MNAWTLSIGISLYCLGYFIGISLYCLGYFIGIFIWMPGRLFVFVLTKHDAVRIRRHVNIAYQTLEHPMGSLTTQVVFEGLAHKFFHWI